MNNLSKYNWLLIAGIAGGIAEVIWVGLYTLTVDIQLSEIGRLITTTFYPNSTELYLAPVIGLAIHLMLSILLAFGFGYTLLPVIERIFNTRLTSLVASIVTLAMVWKFNFFFLLPIWNPEFVSLLPMTVTLISKTLFGVSMGMVLMVYRKNCMLQPAKS